MEPPAIPICGPHPNPEAREARDDEGRHSPDYDVTDTWDGPYDEQDWPF